MLAPNLIVIRLGLFLIFSTAVCFGDTLDYTVEPRLKDNFLEAKFRFVIPDPQVVPDNILIFIPGTDADGRGTVMDPTFLAIAKSCHSALLGCYYRGEGLGYDNPRGGSGQALDQAISYFASKSGKSKLASAPLLLIGESQGGNFAFNYICWRPERVKAFAALKYIAPELAPTSTSMEVPGLLAAGEIDEPGRIRGITNAFIEAAGKHSKWTFLFEKGASHGMDQGLLDFIHVLFKANTQPNATDSPVLLNSETGGLETQVSVDAAVCWFPNQQAAEAWKALQKPMPLQKLITLPDRPSLQSLVSVEKDPETYECENGGSQTGEVTLSGNEARITIDRVEIAGSGFTVDSSRAGILPMQIKVHFAPHGLPWGRVRADIEVGGSRDGQSVDSFSVAVSGAVKGPVKAVPSMAYLGVITSIQPTDQTISLKADRPVHISEIHAPNGMTVTLEPPEDANGMPRLHVHWMAGERLGTMQDEILLTIDSPEKGTLRIPVFGVIARSNP